MKRLLAVACALCAMSMGCSTGTGDEAKPVPLLNEVGQRLGTFEPNANTLTFEGMELNTVGFPWAVRLGDVTLGTLQDYESRLTVPAPADRNQTFSLVPSRTQIDDLQSQPETSGKDLTDSEEILNGCGYFGGCTETCYCMGWSVGLFFSRCSGGWRSFDHPFYRLRPGCF